MFYGRRDHAHRGGGLQIDQQEAIHRIIFEDLVRGIASDVAGKEFEEICLDLLGNGAEAILLGCTELKLLPLQPSTKERAIDSAHVHAKLLWERATQAKG